tara:strand:- start:1979 stop:2572 length:594 start_codon:yes stop_codon:yes gene_type:complete
MKKTSLILLGFFFVAFCSGINNSDIKAKKIGNGIYEQAGWFFDLKQLPTGEDIVPYFTVMKLSANTIKAQSLDGNPTEMGIIINFKVGKSGSDKNVITGVYIESSAFDESNFKFPVCLSICPLKIEIQSEIGGIEEIKSSYSRSNVFRMQLEDDVLSDLALKRCKIRIRIPVSVNTANTLFEWFELDLSDFTSSLYS